MNHEAETGQKQTRKFTGWHMLMITVGFFAVIIAVNFFMAYKAVSTFPGLEVRNGYVASQQFDRLAAAQRALGWTVSAQVDDSMLRMDILGPDGQFVQASSIEATIGRSTERNEDQVLRFQQAPEGYYLAPIRKLAPGKWYLRLKALADDGTLFQQRLTLFVQEE